MIVKCPNCSHRNDFPILVTPPTTPVRGFVFEVNCFSCGVSLKMHLNFVDSVFELVYLTCEFEGGIRRQF